MTVFPSRYIFAFTSVIYYEESNIYFGAGLCSTVNTSQDMTMMDGISITRIVISFCLNVVFLNFVFFFLGIPTSSPLVPFFFPDAQATILVMTNDKSAAYVTPLQGVFASIMANSGTKHNNQTGICHGLTRFATILLTRHCYDCCKFSRCIFLTSRLISMSV